MSVSKLYGIVTLIKKRATIKSMETTEQTIGSVSSNEFELDLETDLSWWEVFVVMSWTLVMGGAALSMLVMLA